MKLVHYSREKRTVIDPIYQGQGQCGAERSEFDNQGKLQKGFLPKSCWYIDNYRAERRFNGYFKHIIDIDRGLLYNLEELPIEHIQDRDVYIASLGFIGWYINKEEVKQARLFIRKGVKYLCQDTKKRQRS
jgi:hypothetical protein